MWKLILSTHAKRRWDLRFYNKDLKEEWDKSTIPAGKKRKQIAKQCPAHNTLESDYRVSENVVFVVGKDDVIITVFHLRLKDRFCRGKQIRIREKKDLKKLNHQL